MGRESAKASHQRVKQSPGVTVLSVLVFIHVLIVIV